MKSRIFGKLFVISVLTAFSITTAFAATQGEPRKAPQRRKIETRAKSVQEKVRRKLPSDFVKRELRAVPGSQVLEVDIRQMTAIAQALGTGLYDVGIIPGGNTCPAGSARVTIFMDDEDDRNANGHWGWLGAITQGTGYHGWTRFVFCKVDGTTFKPFTTPDCNNRRTHYAVLKMGATCPPGSNEFSRHFDNEDDNNINSSTGNIYPNTVGRNTRLYFCLFRSGTQTMNGFPNVGIQYGVFAPGDFIKGIAPGYVYTDDEDDDNINRFDAPNWLWTDAQRIISGNRNTSIRLYRVK